MIGISIYLSDPRAEERIIRASAMGIKQAFTSFHIPEEPAGQERIRQLLSLFHDEGFEVFADVSRQTPEMLGLTCFREMRSLGVTALRLDDGFSREDVEHLSHHFKLAINASTVRKEEVEDWLGMGIDPSALIAWHNFYPRRETGISSAFFRSQQRMFDSFGIPVYAFVPGDEEQRGPLFQGLPTLEDHRHGDPYVHAAGLFHEGVSGVFIGDPGWSAELLHHLHELDGNGIITLSYEGSSEVEGEYSLRPDPGRDVLRIMNTRTAAGVSPEACIERTPGAITRDNDDYGRYRGEMGIVIRPLEADPSVNVVGWVHERHMPLLQFLKPSQRIRFKKYI
ncbi:MupG family TIM beta-alpha barrel fold protein [Rossellomorea marisflavi]|uniref:DUF871 domain-containing protein n=1 Tax=Rossellomorea marisflavi TaxID=189381 RepID=A0A161TLW5_9BACI|nr:MupG family TIM beta-alpha barrel fold protein [Rossellomorea marisflavi]KMK92966.1 hypothetical protein VL03_15595 [Rossellomorea marisflavi]KZE52540.1 hypothetical protein AV649_12425 [Rossellomorea marisflavi]USK91692.1 MupG family TIM beta-alpha barrel fold protein [Rossellomorea marisflavi]